MGSSAAIDVLIVDDHEQFVDVLTAILGAEEGLEVVGKALNGEEALEVAARVEPDVVLMDISMPGVDGFEATRRILAERPSAQVIMVTGSSAEEDRARARRAGAVGYIQKERVLDELAKTVRTAARRRELS